MVIETGAGRLLPTSGIDDQVVIYEVTELIEEAPDVGVVASHGIDPYLKDFASVVSFSLNVTCTPSPALTSRLTGGVPSPSVNVNPSSLVHRAFDQQVWCQDDDATNLKNVVRDLIGLERRYYLAAMRAIRTYVTALHRIVDDLEVAYTLLIASIESLAQGHSALPVDWGDYDESKRLAIDGALGDADLVTIERVRNTLLKIEHTSLMRRFREFTIDHVQTTFFREEAANIQSPVGRADLISSLGEAYRLRSRYIHNLRELPELLRIGASKGDTMRIGHKTFLTFQGLSRVARHVIREFIRRQPKVDSEIYDYHPERAGIVYARMAPEYWVGREEGLTVSSGRKYLEGFLEQLSACLEKSGGAKITRNPKVLAKIETMLPGLSRSTRAPFLALYILLNILFTRDQWMAKFETIWERYLGDMDSLTVEAMLVHLVLGRVPEWPLNEHRRLHDRYFQDRNSRNGLKVPKVMEAGLSLVLAERYRLQRDLDGARSLVCSAVENYPGNAVLLEFERAFDGGNEIVWREAVVSAEKPNVEVPEEPK